MSWLAVGGLAISAAGSVAGGIMGQQKAPTPTQYTQVSPQQQQQLAISGNLSNEGSIEQLLGQGNAFTQNQATSLMNTAVPGYSAVSGQLMNKASSLAANPYALPADVQAQLTQASAEAGADRGTSGQFNQFSAARDLGLNELQYGQQNLQSAQSMYGLVTSLAPRVNPMSPMSLYVNPSQQIQTATQNSQGVFGATSANNNASAAASNANASMWGHIVSGIGGEIGGAMSGGMGSSLGGMMGGGGGSASGGAFDASGAPSYGGAMGICWVAREVYGDDNPKWKEFRTWLLNEAPDSLREFYIANGESIAAKLRDLPDAKTLIRMLMDSALASSGQKVEG